MANSLSHITNRIFTGEADPSQGTSSTATVESSADAPVDTPNDTSTDPSKRKRGRPKGSVRKSEQPPSEPKAKRPVGRPRKDGLPAGSVPKRSPVKRQKLEPGEGFPQWGSGSILSGVGYPMAPPPPPITYASSESKYFIDDWGQLAYNNPQEFLAALLTALAAPNPRSLTGPTVEDAFKMHLQSLTPTVNSSQTHNIPMLYSILRTFWLPSSPAYFSMAASATNARMAAEYKFFYWDPQPLVFNGIQCPYCPNYLTNNGRLRSGPIKIYDLETPFFVIGCEYVCTSEQCVASTSSEGRKFSSIDASIMNALPKGLRDEFPARLLYLDTDAGSGPNIWNWNALGASTALWNLVMGSLNLGLRKQAILQLIHSIQYGAPPVKFEMKDEDQHPSMSVNTSAGGDCGQPLNDSGAAPGIIKNIPVGSGNSTPQTAAVQNSWNENRQVDSDLRSSSTFSRSAQNSEAIPPTAIESENAEMNNYAPSRQHQQQQPRQSSVFSSYAYSQYAFYPDQRSTNDSPVVTDGEKAIH